MTKLSTLSIVCAAIGAVGTTHGFSTTQRASLGIHQSNALFASATDEDTSTNPSSRRNFLTSAASIMLPTLLSLSNTPPVYASGGATAGKYTTIPIAKRRYYGRVQEVGVSKNKLSCSLYRLSTSHFVLYLYLLS